MSLMATWYHTQYVCCNLPGITYQVSNISMQRVGKSGQYAGETLLILLSPVFIIEVYSKQQVGPSPVFIDLEFDLPSSLPN